MHADFPPIGGSHAGIGGENSFWPSFTDVMMVITLIFLMATSLLVVRNWQLVAELQESVAAERLAAQIIESTTQENVTLEERLANAEQANSILRLRLLKRDEELASAQTRIRAQAADLASLERSNVDLRQTLDQTRARLETANLEIDAMAAQSQELSARLDDLRQRLAQQELASEQTRESLTAARQEIAALVASSENQQRNIALLTEERDQLAREKSLLNDEIAAYNRQLLTLKGEYETVKSKYEELIKPARSARGKYIAEVYYIKGEDGNIIRYREPGGDFSRLNLAEVERRLGRLKQEKGKDLYVKIIIPQDSGLTYNEAWDFMRNLLVKYDYYYQE